MERKLVKQGQNALTVTLPAKWLKQKGLKAGGSVFLEVENNEVLVKSTNSSQKKETILDVRGEEISFMWHTLMSKYVDGYDRITILHNSPGTMRELSNGFLGMIIEEHSSSKTIMKNMISEPEADIQIIIRRIVHMFLQQAVLLEELSKGKCSFEDLKAQEKLLDTNIAYCLRYINKYHLKQDSYRYFLLCATIEEAADMISLISKHIENDRKLGEKIKQILEIYNKYLFSGNLKKLYTELRTFRNSISKKTFLDGLVFQLAETIYNNIGYLMSKE